eukprot:957774_1
MERCKQWDQFKDATAVYIKKTMDRLMHQLGRQAFNDENIALLDELIVELQMSSNHNRYLDQTLKYRERLVNNLSVEIEGITSIVPDQLIPPNDVDQSERYQICEMSFTPNTNTILRIFFYENISNINNKVFLRNANEDKQQNVVFIGADNIGLDAYNYYLLHSQDATIAPLMVESFDHCTITIDVVYTSMYRSTSHHRLDEIRANMILAEEAERKTLGQIDVVRTFRFGRTLGSGASSRVVQASNHTDRSQKCAIKIMDKDRAVIGQLYKREVDILQRLTPNLSTPPKGILPLVGHGEDNDSFYIVTQLLSGGELFDRIVSKSDKYKITEKAAVKLVGSMLASVKYCHDRNVVHRDLKPENFIFSNTRVDSDLVLIDFGCALSVSDDEIVDDVVGTAYYLAPELAIAACANYRTQGRAVSRKIGEPKPRTGRILKAADVWGIGVIAYVMMTGRAPFRGRDNMRIFESTILKTLFFPKNDARYHNELKLSDHFKDFVRKILVKDPSQRMSIEDAMRHPWIQGVDASDYRLNQ